MIEEGTEPPASATGPPTGIAGRAPLDRGSPLPLSRQLYLWLYRAITHGELPDGETLPAGRALAGRLGVARNTVLEAYAQLAADGLVEAAGRRGTRVSHAASVAPMPHRRPDRRNGSRHGEDPLGTSDPAPWSLSKRSATGAGILRPLPLSPGEPDPALFPHPAWCRAMASAARLPRDQLGYRSDVAVRLQGAIARHLALYRSLVVDPQRIVITSSTRQSLLLGAALYGDPGERAAVECPGYPGALDAMRAQGLVPCALAIDGQGAMLPDGAAPAIACLTPCFQYPLGMPMSPVRRDAFLDYSARHGTVLIEDDYDSEFRDDVTPRPALAALAEERGARVLHAGTFSKLIFPAARVAWLVVPGDHADTARGMLRRLGGGHGTLNQAAVAELLERGTVSAHLERARAVYAGRRRVWEACVADGVGLDNAGGGGLCAQVSLDEPVELIRLEVALVEAGLGALPLERFDWAAGVPRTTRTLVAGLGNVASLQLPAHVARLHAVVSSCR